MEDGRVKVYPGNYEDYLWRKAGGGSSPAADRAAGGASDGMAQAPVAVEAAAAPAVDGGGAKRLNPIKLRQMRERRSSIEDEVTKLEAEIADYETALSNFVSVEETTRVHALLEQRRADLEGLMNEWEEVAQTIEANT